MSFKLEDLPDQRQAIEAVVRLFEGQQRNYFGLQFADDCFPNRLDLSCRAMKWIADCKHDAGKAAPRRRWASCNASSSAIATVT